MHDERGKVIKGHPSLLTIFQGVDIFLILGCSLRTPKEDEFSNVYADKKRAKAYAALEFPGTYYLAYRDLPEIIATHVNGRKAVDFGCGTGRSTRFLKKIGFDVIGIDIAEEMIQKARELDPCGDYRLVGNGIPVKDCVDLVLSVFTFDNILMDEKVENFKELERLLKRGGRIINVVSSPEIYTHEWASFSTKDFPENNLAKSGDKVRIVQTDIEDERPVVDIICSDTDYKKIYEMAGLKVIAVINPLAQESEPYKWVNETRIAPWVIYVLERVDKSAG